MKLNVGDYVRTENGIIAKYHPQCVELNKFENRYYYVYEDEIEYYDHKDLVIKSSPNIIDLIGRFDLVNEHLVICKMYEDEEDIPTIIKCVGDYYFKEKDIKSIVTKEQMEQMEYKVED